MTQSKGYVPLVRNYEHKSCCCWHEDFLGRVNKESTTCNNCPSILIYYIHKHNLSNHQLQFNSFLLSSCGLTSGNICCFSCKHLSQQRFSPMNHNTKKKVVMFQLQLFCFPITPAPLKKNQCSVCSVETDELSLKATHSSSLKMQNRSRLLRKQGNNTMCWTCDCCLCLF